MEITDIVLHQKSGTLELVFSDGIRFILPIAYLHKLCDGWTVDAPEISAQACATIFLDHIAPADELGLTLYFSDGQTRTFSWTTLYAFGMAYTPDWLDFLANLKTTHMAIAPGGKPVKLLYFAQLVQLTGKAYEFTSLPHEIDNTGQLLVWLQTRGGFWNEQFTDVKVQVTVNRQIATHGTPIAASDEIAFVPKPC